MNHSIAKYVLKTYSIAVSLKLHKFKPKYILNVKMFANIKVMVQNKRTFGSHLGFHLKHGSHLEKFK